MAESAEILENLVKLYPNSSMPHALLYQIYRHSEIEELELKEMKRMVELEYDEPDFAINVERAYAQSGMLSVRKLLLEVFLNNNADQSLILDSYLSMGEWDIALDMLEKGYEEKQYWMTDINSEPEYRNPEIKSNPRFIAILEKMNFN